MDMKELINIEIMTPAAVYSAGGIDEILDSIRGFAGSLVPDVSTAKGRKEIAAVAYKVAKSKTHLDALGKELVFGWKESAKKVDADRKRMRDELDALKDEVRAPLTAWEDAENCRINNHVEKIQSISEFGVNALSCWSDMGAERIRDDIIAIENVRMGKDWDEFAGQAAEAKDIALSQLKEALLKAEKHEAEQAELARLRKEAEDKAIRERDEQIATDARNKALKEAEESRQAVLAQAAKDAESARLKIAEGLAEVERQRKHAESEAIKEKLASEQREKQAVENERLRVEREAESVRLKSLARERDVAHKAGVNRNAMSCFVSGGLDKESAKLAVTLIAKGAVSNITIQY